MSDKDVKINIETKADTAGAKAAEKALDATNAATVRITDTTIKDTAAIEENKKAFAEWQKERDAARKKNAGKSFLAVDPATIAEEERAVAAAIEQKEIEEEATRRLAEQEKILADAIKERKQAAQADEKDEQAVDKKLDRVVRIQTAQVAAEIGRSIGTIGNSLREMAAASAIADPALSKTLENAAAGLDSVGAGLTGAAQGFAVGGPLGAAIGGTVGLMTGPLKSAISGYLDSLRAQGEAEAAAAASTERLKQVRAKLAHQIKHEKLAEFFTEELAIIDRQLAAIERRSKVLAAERSANTAEREARQFASGNQNFAQSQAADASGDFADARAAIQDEIAKAQAVAVELEQKALALEFKADRIAGLEGEMDASAVAARETARQAREASDAAQADAEAAGQIAEAKLRELISAFSTRLEEAAQVVEKEAATEAQKVIDKITSSGQALTEQQKLANETAQKILEDGRVTAAEQQQLQVALSTLILGWRNDINQVQAVLAEANKISSSLASGLSALREEQTRIRNQIAQNQTGIR